MSKIVNALIKFDLIVEEILNHRFQREIQRSIRGLIRKKTV